MSPWSKTRATLICNELLGVVATLSIVIQTTTPGSAIRKQSTHIHETASTNLKLSNSQPLGNISPRAQF